ncbi:hypothetical protein [Shewanella sp. NIFS-20-20]|uniref:hypothetical protein n=1 Tax=Shewanella sp. NIFS-20-20 TaxID=2853806 RepID=UPI001C457768|nr:hypothetical protein [Shewanella sp. NIFS-20-20]MBV7315468.1 hypothetical protein [Shewanella sp. NIFS-20-20]
MKKLLLLTMAFVMPSYAASIDDIVKSFEMSNVYVADWYRKGDSLIAESHNEYRDLKINLSETKGALTIKLPASKEPDIISIMPCYKLTAFIDYDKSPTWNDPETEDEKLIKTVFYQIVKNGEEKQVSLNGWKLTMKRYSNMFSCEVAKQ